MREKGKNDTRQVIDRAIAGDQKAYEEIVEEYHERIYHFINKMVRDSAQAQDLTQVTFIKAFRALATFNSEYAFSTWLYKIAANNCIDFFRKKKLKTYSLDTPIQGKDGELQRDYPDHEQNPEDELIARERDMHVHEAINSLPEKYRIAIILRHAKDKSYEEIAKELSLPLGTVKVRIFRAREMLKKKLKEQLRSG